MATTRMNKDDRDIIGQTIVEAKFGPLDAALTAQETALAQRVYDSLYDDKTKKWIAEAPSGWLSTTSSIKCNVAGLSVSVSFGYLPQSNHRVHKPVTTKHAAGWDTIKTFPAGDTLGEEIRAHALAKEEHKRLRSGAYRQVATALASLRTFEAALKAWPEAETFIKPRMQTRCVEVPGLPAVKMADLNTLLGLPPETKQPIGAAQPK